MSAQLQSPQPEASKAYVYDHIPLLRELLPKQHGRPGITYAQVCCENQWRAEEQGWSRVDGTAIYTIQSPKGLARMVLMGKGKLLKGLGHASGKRQCVIDLDVEKLTGLLVKSKPLNTATEVNTDAGKVNESTEQRTGNPVQRSQQAKAG